MASPRKPARQQPEAAGAETHGRITGVDFREIRTGEDTRQRGWFWHWNELHTEYEPLLKHSGIGLITSYIVWTDRREDSPYRGYAFPSLQSQAAFSGSDRAELITINRILVALDLIEIRKEMVLRVDEQGHQWRVPHNLYRVKDRSGDPHLTTADVLRVLELAEERQDVYRHIRHILTSSFVPISRTNIWHQILAELRSQPVWQRLAARALAEEERLSARSRAGHVSRRSAQGEDVPVEPVEGGGPRAVAPIDDHADFFVPGTELVESTATGESVESPPDLAQTVDAASNGGLPTSVGQSNQAFDEDRPSSGGGSNQGRPTSVAPTNPMQDQSKQATRTTKGVGGQRPERAVTDGSGSVTGVVTSTGVTLSQASSGPGSRRAPESGPDRAAALVAFAEANSRQASAAEERLLAGIAAEVAGDRGWELVTAAIYEAVDSGSAYVAPKRVREIVRRWLRDGHGPAAESDQSLPLEAVAAGSEQRGEASGDHGAGSNGPLGFDQAGEGAGIQPVQDGVESRRDVGNQRSAAGGEPFWVDEAGLGSESLWAAVVDLVEQSGAIRPAEVHDYLKPAVLLGRSGGTALRLGVAHELARQRIERRWRTNLEDALGRLLGGANWELEIEVHPHHHRKSA
jgi:hypothetical protein